MAYENSERIEVALKKKTSKRDEINVSSDIYGLALSLFNNYDGINGILAKGSIAWVKKKSSFFDV